MHQRFLPWLLLGVLFAAVSLRAQTNPPPGKILVAKISSGKPWKTVNGVKTELIPEMEVEQAATVNTGADGSVILAFSNGATTKLGADTELVIDQFLQDPFNDTIQVAKMDKEPSRSKTKLSLNRGELVGDVKQLLHEQGSEFIVNTPVGAAGIRGTVFRIVFRPAANGQAFFQLTTSSGRVDYAQGQGGTTPGGTAVTAQGTAAVPVPQGQEIEITVDVTTNAQGQMVVTALPPAPSTANSAPPAVLAQVTTAAVEIAGAVQNAVFTSQSNTGTGTTSGGGATTGSISGQNQNQNQGNQNQGQPQNQGQNQTQNQGQSGQGGTNPTTTTSFQTQNTSGTVNVTQPRPQTSIPSGQLTSSP